MVRAAARRAWTPAPIGLSLRRVLRHRRRRRHRRAGAARRRRRRRGRRLHDAHPPRDGRGPRRRSTRRSPPRGAATCRWSSRITSAPGRSNWGRTVQTLAHIDAARARPADRPRLLSVHRRLDRAAQRPGRRHHRRPRHVVDAASGDGGAHARRHRRRVGLHAEGSVRAAAAGRRLLLPDARGRRAARPALPGDDDRLRRPAARPASASAPVGNVSARARPLQPRPRPVPARDRGAQDDRPVGAPVPPRRPRRDPRRRLRRRRRVRCGDDRRHRDVRAAEGARRRHRLRAGERPGRLSARRRRAGKKRSIPGSGGRAQNRSSTR